MALRETPDGTNALDTIGAARSLRQYRCPAIPVCMGCFVDDIRLFVPDPGPQVELISKNPMRNPLDPVEMAGVPAQPYK